MYYVKFYLLAKSAFLLAFSTWQVLIFLSAMRCEVKLTEQWRQKSCVGTLLHEKQLIKIIYDNIWHVKEKEQNQKHKRDQQKW